MKKFFLLPIVAVLATACTSVPKEHYERRAYEENKIREARTEMAIKQAPKWMVELPKSNAAVFENGTATSSDLGMAVAKARTMAYAKICMAAGGKVNQQTKIFRSDSTDSGSEFSELAVRAFCPNVDITGAEIVESKLTNERGRFRAYVLMSLPTGDSITLRREQQREQAQKNAIPRSEQAFRELEKQTQ